MKIEFTSIGIINTPFDKLEGMPIQPVGAAGISGSVEVFAEYADGLQDLAGFSHIILLYHFHRSEHYSLRVVPFMETTQRGLFSTRAPKRPNPIGLSIVKLLGIEGRTLLIENVDMLNGTPLLDIKPYVPEFDHREEVRTGWLEKVQGRVHRKKSDGRFR